MDPITMTVVAAAVVGIAGLVGAARYRSRAKDAEIAVLGPRRAGKSCLLSALLTGEVPKAYTPTTLRQTNITLLDRTAKNFAIKMSRYKFKIKTTDVNGERGGWRDWKISADKSRLVCFLVSAPSLLRPGGAEVAVTGAQQVGSWRLTAPILLVLTHVDEDPQRDDPDAILGRPAVQALRRALGTPDLHLVSLIDPEERNPLLLRILEILDRPKEAS